MFFRNPTKASQKGLCCFNPVPDSPQGFRITLRRGLSATARAFFREHFHTGCRLAASRATAQPWLSCTSSPQPFLTLRLKGVQKCKEVGVPATVGFSAVGHARSLDSKIRRVEN